ncbi:hypothetical protein POSPLADRAFT_1115719, partial [Postia placenta MAD-698-R-SB12]
QQRMDVFEIEATFQGWLQVLDLPCRDPASERAAGVTVSHSDRGTAQRALPGCVAAYDGALMRRDGARRCHTPRAFQSPSEPRDADASQVYLL